jgi:O-antigen ligase
LLHVLAETGIVGLLGFVTAIVASLIRVGSRIIQNRRALDAGATTSGARVILDRLALFGVLSVLILGATHSPLHHAPVALLFWTLLGVAAGSRPPAEKGASDAVIGTVEPVVSGSHGEKLWAKGHQGR